MTSLLRFNKVIKKLVSKETLLSFPDFSKCFDIYTDANHTQLGAVITQENKPIAFYSRKLNPAQTRYTGIGKQKPDDMSKIKPSVTITSQAIRTKEYSLYFSYIEKCDSIIHRSRICGYI